jgi:hypothetical protein
MAQGLIPFQIKGVMPTGPGCAVFLSSDTKSFVIHMDASMGQSISMQLQHVHKERPLTHDLISTIFIGLGITLEHIIINDIVDATFYARIILRMENELGQKVIEIDARPSDAIILAMQSNRPIFVSPQVVDQVEDISDIIDKLLEQKHSEDDPFPSEDEGPALG